MHPPNNIHYPFSIYVSLEQLPLSNLLYVFLLIWLAQSEKEMATHSSILAWRIPGMGEPGGLQSMGSLRVGDDWATSLSLFTSMHWRRKWQPTPVFLPGESQGRGSLVGCCYGVAQSRTRLKQLSSSSSRLPIEFKLLKGSDLKLLNSLMSSIA